MGDKHEAVVVGAGPNGLAAAITLAQAGVKVLVLEAAESAGGGCRTAELTLPGFQHDICAAIHPMGIASPFFKGANLKTLEWAQPEIAMAHPLRDGGAAFLHQSIEETAKSLDEDGNAWIRLLQPFVENASTLLDETLRPIRLPRHPLLLAKFGLLGLRSCKKIVESRFKNDPARALFAGCAAHSVLPLDHAASASFGIVLAMAAHTVGWPCTKSGSQRIIDAMLARLKELGGELQTNRKVSGMMDIPAARAILFDLSPRQIAAIARDELPARYARRLEAFRFGPGVFKVDWALSEPIPWTNRDCRRAGTVHVGGTYEEIARAEAAAWRGEISEYPFVLFAQQSIFDGSRAPRGKHTGWAYCHVPHGCEVDFTDRIEAQIERFAPGFRDVILARHTMGTKDYERHNANMIGGDIAGGANDLGQFLMRPVIRWNPYTTPNPRLYICSSSTPPGGGVHGMCGYWAAKTALQRL